MGELSRALKGLVISAKAIAKKGRRTNDDWSRLRAAVLMADTAIENNKVKEQYDECTCGPCVLHPEPNPKEAICVEVKPLAWDWNGASFFASTVVGEYRVSKTQNKTNDRFMVTYVDPNRKSHTIGYVDGEDLAKTFAQADYEQRIRSALTLRTVEDVRRELWEATVKLLLEHGASHGAQVLRFAGPPALSRETQPSPEPAACRTREELDGAYWNKWIERSGVTSRPDELRQAKVVTIGYHADELRQAKAEAWSAGWIARKYGKSVQANPYAAPDEGGQYE